MPRRSIRRYRIGEDMVALYPAPVGWFWKTSVTRKQRFGWALDAGIARAHAKKAIADLASHLKSS